MLPGILNSFAVGREVAEMRRNFVQVRRVKSDRLVGPLNHSLEALSSVLILFPSCTRSCSWHSSQIIAEMSPGGIKPLSRLPGVL